MASTLCVSLALECGDLFGSSFMICWVTIFKSMIPKKRGIFLVIFVQVILEVGQQLRDVHQNNGGAQGHGSEAWNAGGGAQFYDSLARKGVRQVITSTVPTRHRHQL